MPTVPSNPAYQSPGDEAGGMLGNLTSPGAAFILQEFSAPHLRGACRERRVAGRFCTVPVQHFLADSGPARGTPPHPATALQRQPSPRPGTAPPRLADPLPGQSTAT